MIKFKYIIIMKKTLCIDCGLQQINKNTSILYFNVMLTNIRWRISRFLKKGFMSTYALVIFIFYFGTAGVT